MPLAGDYLVPAVVSSVPNFQPPDTIVTSTAAWYNLDWTVLSEIGPQSIETTVATGSDCSLIQYREAKRQGLAMHRLLERGYVLEGFGGGRERISTFVEIELECPLIGLERVKVPVLVVRSKQIVGLLIGTRTIDEYKIIEKISAARRQHGCFPPGTNIDHMANHGNVTIRLFDGRPERTLRRPSTPPAYRTILTKTDDQESHKQEAGDSLEAMNSVLQAKAFGSSVALPSTASSTPASSSISRALTLSSDETAVTVFSAIESIVSTAATSARPSSVAWGSNAKK